MAGFGYVNWIFYDLNELDKTPPLNVDGKLTFADSFGRGTTVLVLGLTVFTIIVTKEYEDPSKQVICVCMCVCVCVYIYIHVHVNHVCVRTHYA